jgi:anti-sigma B factor antagonist
MSLTTRARHSGGVTIVDIDGRILGEDIAELRNLVCELLSKGQSKILFNLGGVHYIDTSGVGYLVGACTHVRKKGGELKLVNLTKNVNDVIKTTNLYTVFDITDDEAEGVKSFGCSV